MIEKRFFERMSELEELSKGVLAVPVQEHEQKEAYEMTKKAIELVKQGKTTQSENKLPQQTSRT